MNFAEKCRSLNDSEQCRADCCGPTPMTREFVVAHFLQIEERLEYTLVAIPGMAEMMPVTEDDRCLFLNRASNTCRIYDQRPHICQQFGDESHPLLSCPWMDNAGDERTRQQRRELQRKLSKFREKYTAEARKRGKK